MVYEALMITTAELEHRLALMLESEHKLGYFNVQQRGKKICSIKNSSHADSPH